VVGGVVTGTTLRTVVVVVGRGFTVVDVVDVEVDVVEVDVDVEVEELVGVGWTSGWMSETAATRTGAASAACHANAAAVASRRQIVALTAIMR
jgi:hypothetical protein